MIFIYYKTSIVDRNVILSTDTSLSSRELCRLVWMVSTPLCLYFIVLFHRHFWFFNAPINVVNPTILTYPQLDSSLRSPDSSVKQCQRKLLNPLVLKERYCLKFFGLCLLYMVFPMFNFVIVLMNVYQIIYKLAGICSQ